MERRFDARGIIAGGLMIALGIAIVAIVWLFARALALLLIAITIADALSPIVRRLHARLGNRTLAVFVTYLAMLGLLALALWFIAPRLAGQFNDILAQLPRWIDRLRVWASTWSPFPPSELAGKALSADAVTSWLASIPGAVASGLFEFVLVVFLSFYWLLSMPPLDRFLGSLVPESRRREFDELLNGMSQAMGGYLRGAVLNGLATGAAAGIALYIAGIDYPVMLGVITAILELIPYAGPVIAAIPAVGAGLLQSPAKGLLALIIYIGVQQLEGHILTPNIMRSQTNIPQPLVIFALFAGGAVGGLLGAIVAIPLSGALLVAFKQLVVPGIRKWAGAA